jgi:hypothetical protein
LIYLPYILQLNLYNLTTRVKKLIKHCLSKKIGEQKFQYLVIGRDKCYYIKSHSISYNEYIQNHIMQMLDLLSTIAISMGTSCAPLLVDLFLHPNEANILQWLFRNKDRKLSQTFKSSFHNIDDVLPLNNYRFGYYFHLIYPIYLKVKDTTAFTIVLLT